MTRYVGGLKGQAPQKRGARRMTLRSKVLMAAVVFLAVVVTPPLSFFLYYSLDAPPPDDADLPDASSRDT